MPRKLKTFVTESGFFELAVAAPSMKAALKDWGIEVNLFQQGLARQTDDPAIVAAAQSAPGTVLRRPIGSKVPFRESAELPKVKASGRIKSRSQSIDRPANKATSKSAKSKSARRAKTVTPGAVDLRAIREARAVLEMATAQHRKNIVALDKERDALERRAEREEEDWRQKKEKLEEKINRLKA